MAILVRSSDSNKMTNTRRLIDRHCLIGTRDVGDNNQVLLNEIVLDLRIAVEWRSQILIFDNKLQRDLCNALKITTNIIGREMSIHSNQVISTDESLGLAKDIVVQLVSMRPSI